MKLCQLASGQCFSVTCYAETGFKSLSNSTLESFESIVNLKARSVSANRRHLKTTSCLWASFVVLHSKIEWRSEQVPTFFCEPG